MNDPRALWQSLRHAGIVTGEMPPGEVSPPWYVRGVQGIAGWMAALFVLTFLEILFHELFQRSSLALMTGAVLIAAAVAILRVAGQSFAGQFGLAISLAGQVLCFISQQEHWRGSLFWLVWAALQAGLCWSIAQPVHRFLSALAVIFALGAALAHTALVWMMPSLLMLGAAAFWLTEPRWLPRSALWGPVAWALTTAMIQTHAFTLLNPAFWAELMRHQDFLATPGHWILRMNEVVMAFAWMASGLWLIRENGCAVKSANGVLACVGLAAIALLTQEARGLAIAWLLMILGFARANRLLGGLGVALFWVYLGHYYYSLQLSLLYKSGLLAVCGIVLLTGYVALRGLSADGEKDDA
jgi:hypothetical protein